MDPEVLTASHVSVRYGSDAAPVLREVDLVVTRGGSIGIVGESGSGKTTLARALAGTVRPSEGEVRISGTLWSDVRRKDPLRRSVQMIFQDPYGSLNPAMTALQMVAEVFRHWDGLSPASAKNAAEALLKEVGLSPEVFDVRPARLSGGQCQRIGIARALACKPSVLIADEPTSALDVSVQAQILNLLMDLRESRGLALLFVSHDLRVVRWITDYLVVLYGGVIVEEGPTEELFDRPLHHYTRALVASLPGRSAAGVALTIGGAVARTSEASERGCIFAARCPHVTADCEVSQPPLIQMLERRVACLHPISYSGEESSTAWS